MSAHFLYDPDDPFGSRADEKPPAGWQEGFWDEVRGRIEHESARGGGEPPLPEPAAGRRAGPAVAALILLAAAAVMGLMRASRFEAGPGPRDPATTHVRVNGSQRPEVAVEWARTGGEASTYVVLRSINPDISWVVLDEKRPDTCR